MSAAPSVARDFSSMLNPACMWIMTRAAGSSSTFFAPITPCIPPHPALIRPAPSTFPVGLEPIVSLSLLLSTICSTAPSSPLAATVRPMMASPLPVDRDPPNHATFWKVTFQLKLAAQKKRTAPYRQRSFLLHSRGVDSYAISGMRLTACSCGICFFNHTLALHRPMNGATAIIPNATPNAICINISFLPKVLNILLG